MGEECALGWFCCVLFLFSCECSLVFLLFSCESSALVFFFHVAVSVFCVGISYDIQEKRVDGFLLLIRTSMNCPILHATQFLPPFFKNGKWH